MSDSPTVLFDSEHVRPLSDTVRQRPTVVRQFDSTAIGFRFDGLFSLGRPYIASTPPKLQAAPPLFPVHCV